MVVIEEETTHDPVSSRAPGKEASIASDEETNNKEVEGYQTAGEGDGEGEEEVAPPKGDSYEDALTDEQLKERALSQAIDAKAEGNKLFGAGKYEDALSQYELALEVAPEMPSSVEIRSICHANRAICFSKLGRYDDTIKECTKALELNPMYMKALVRRGETHEKLENYEEAIADMKKILELDPSNKQAIINTRRLEPLAAEKREKMKEEMIGGNNNGIKQHLSDTWTPQISALLLGCEQILARLQPY
ncbi:PREDICTED: tetratricopeptide repeat protein 1-like isoform X2 [Nelumbo nucifera]|uniref:Tetratricopeptide repeat protein 1-like isoform X2 n=1 Tax=Nelumbo nucifera TaxID=4432 RepID=A0A1U8AZ54_NELNU|nr:PREDICTED: tetratricopeptide repeat protein 1-like isoform X2 [Nelumbo nucifera]